MSGFAKGKVGLRRLGGGTNLGRAARPNNDRSPRPPMLDGEC